MSKVKRFFKVHIAFLLAAVFVLGALPCGNAVSAVDIPDGYVSTGSAADEKIIWDYFMEKFGNAYGVAGLMGNLFAESGLRSNNLQNSYERKLGFNDTTYTKAVDERTYTNFVYDSAGYGLAQWTFNTRKKALLDFVNSRNVSIGDFSAQLDFLYKELTQSFKGVVNTLKSATSVREASNAVLLKFESPADQSVSVQNERTTYSEKYYNKYANTVSEVIYGDISGDGAVDSADATLALKADAGLLTLSSDASKKGDVSGDGEIDSADATYILKFDAGLIKTFPVKTK